MPQRTKKVHYVGTEITEKKLARNQSSVRSVSPW